MGLQRAPAARHVGNQAMLRRLPAGARARLEVGPVDDPLEREADRVADAVSGAGRPVAAAAPAVHRKCAKCDDETLHRKAADAAGGGAAPAAVHATLATPGEALDRGTRAFFEPRLGADLGDVRVHTDAAAAASARSIGARAYTLGNRIVFGARQYAPASAEGRWLMAHELTHVLQQGPARVRRVAAMSFDPALVAEQLRDAMKGLGTDEDRIYAAMSGRTQAQVDQIAAAYLKLTGNDLGKDLASELNTSELLKLGALAPQAKDDPAARNAQAAGQLARAIGDTDKTAIFAALEGRAPADLAAIKAAYTAATKRDIIADLRGALKGDDLQKALGEIGEAPDVTVKDTTLGGLMFGNFDFHFNNCAVVIEVLLDFNFSNNITPAQQVRFKARFINAVQAVWGSSGYTLAGTAACPCSSVPINVQLRDNSGGRTHKRVDVEKPTPSGPSSGDIAWDQDNARRPKVISDINVNFCTRDETFAHEFGHVLGLYDEYNGGFFENIMFWHKNVKDPKALMNDGGELRPRYFQQYRDEVEKTAPHGCNYAVSAPPAPAVRPAATLDPDC